MHFSYDSGQRSVPGVPWVPLVWLPTMFRFLSLRRQRVPSGAIAALLLSPAFLSSAPQLYAQSSDSQQTSQDPAEAAQQQRAHKQQSSDEHHVYTNEDLQ